MSSLRLSSVPNDMAASAEPSHVVRRSIVTMGRFSSPRLTALFAGVRTDEVAALDRTRHLLMSARHDAGALGIAPVDPLTVLGESSAVGFAPCRVPGKRGRRVHLVSSPSYSLLAGLASVMQSIRPTATVGVEVGSRLGFPAGRTRTIGLHRQLTPGGARPRIVASGPGLRRANCTRSLRAEAM